jgi:hypothetical protein
MLGARIAARLGIALVLAAFAAALTAPAALADGGAPGSIGLTIGPIAVHKGFTLEVYVPVCRAKTPLNVSFFRGREQQEISYGYGAGTATAATAADCRAGGLQRATISGRWSDALGLNLHVVGLGRFVKVARPSFCKGDAGSAREVTLAGTLSVAIAPRLFGRIRVRRVRGMLTRAGRLSCRPRSSSSQIVLQASFAGGREFLSAFSEPHGTSTVDVSEMIPGPIASVPGFFNSYVTGGRALFSWASNLSAAHIGAVPPATRGSLQFQAISGCTTSSAAFGTLKGTLTVNDPLNGPLVLNGAAASSPFILRGSAAPPSCRTASP